MSTSLTAVNTIRTSEIVQIRTESPTVKTFILSDKLCTKAKPGQFLMFWIPGIDEIPLSIMDTSNGLVSVSVKAVGDATRHLHNMEAGQTVGDGEGGFQRTNGRHCLQTGPGCLHPGRDEYPGDDLGEQRR